MASKDDTALWLHNKLGSSTHLWSFSSTVVSQYTVEKLQLIRDCFVTLDSLVKCKFFLSLFYIPKRNLDEFRPIVQEIIDNTIQTCLDQWVLSIATFVRSYWETQILNTESDYEDLESFREAYTDLKQTLKECVSHEVGIQRTRLLLPIECDYLNMRAKSSLLPYSTELFSNTDTFKQHFTLTKSAKSAASLDDLKYKASHYSKSKTNRVFPSSNLLNSYGENSTSSTESKTGSYLSRLSTSKKMDSMISNLSDPYSSKIFSNTSNSLNGGSSSFGNRNSSSNSFFKQSSFSSKSSTLTGKSSNLKRDVGIKLLDAQEQSATPQEAKRKRKEQEKELLKKQKLEQQQQQQLEKEKEKERQMQLKASEKAAEQEEARDLNEQVKDKEAESGFGDNQSVQLIKQEKEMPAIEERLGDTAKSHLPAENNVVHQAPLEPPSQYPAQPSISSLNDLFNPSSSMPPQLSQFSLAQGINPSNVSPLAHFNVVRSDPLMSSPLVTTNNSPVKASYAQFVKQHQQNQQQQQQLQLLHSQHQHLIQQQQQSLYSPHPQLLSFNTNAATSSSQNNNNNNNSSANNSNNNSPMKQFNTNYPLFANNSPLSASNLLSSPLMTLPHSAEQSLADQAQHLHHHHQQQQQQQLQAQLQHHHQQQQAAPQQQKSLSLTREQMLQAQEMFSNSNRLTRPEKALILGFIAGSRDNPHPEHGPLISIKLNEAEEILTINNGQQHRVLSEIFFQMNYDTGEYKRIKKIKPIGMPLSTN